MQRLVVIGGDAAGMSAASQARKRRGPGRAGDRRVRAGARHLVLGVRHPVLDQRCGRATWTSSVPRSRAAPAQRHRRAHPHRGGRDRPGRAARCAARDLDGGAEYDEPFDDLVYATGSVPARPPVPGIDAAGRLRRADPRRRRRAAGRAGRRRTCSRVVIVGGGYIGLEVAEACQVRGLDGDGRRPLRHPGRHVRPRHRHVHRGRRARARHRARARPTASPRSPPTRTAGPAPSTPRPGGSCPPTSSCSGWACGPNVALAREAGIPLGPSGGIAVDHRMRTAGRRGCGRRATASSRSTGCPASASSWRWARTPTSRAGWRASTSAAATPRSPA